MSLRCCASLSIQPCYASACYLGTTSLESKLQDLETHLRPSFTAWCPRCSEVSTLTTDAAKFQCPSAYYAHLLRTHEVCKEFAFCGK